MKKFWMILITISALSLSLKAENSYSFPVMGDFHYDRWELHDLEYVHNTYSSVMYEVVRYTMSTEMFSPILLKTVATKIDDKTPFVVQLGDFTQGTCGSEQLQDKMFEEGFAMVKDAFPSTPFLITKGNHDVRGIGADKSYKNIVFPFLSKETGKKINSANFFVCKNSDLFIFFDAINPNLDWLESCLADNKNCRYVFLFSHYPIIPFEYRAEHLVFKGKNREIENKRLINMLVSSNAVAFCAHMHRASYVKYENEFGTLSQVAHNSVWLSKAPKVSNIIDGANFYSESMFENKQHKTNELKTYRQSLITDAKPYVKDYFYAHSQGYMVVIVNDNEVQVDFYNGVDEKPFKSISHKYKQI